MKFKINKEILNEKLNIVGKAISTKNIIPVLSGIKIDLTNEGLFLTASNDDIAIQTFISKDNIKDINEIGSIIVPGRYFLEIIRKLEDDILNIETDGLKIIISTKRGEYSLNGMNSKDFPNIKMDVGENPIILEQNILKTIIAQTSFAVSTQESRPILTGINVEIDKDVLTFVATDSYRLSKKIIHLDNIRKEKINIVIPGKNLIELSKLINDDNAIELHIFQNSILFKTDEMLFQSRLLNGTYPDTSKLIPNEFELTLSVNLIELMNTIDRVSLLTNEKEKNLVKMNVVENNIILSSNSQEIGKMEETMDIEKDKDIDMQIAYSSKYMMEALRSLRCEIVEIKLKNKSKDPEVDIVEIKLSSEIKPIIIKSHNDDNLIQLVLPIKTF